MMDLLGMMSALMIFGVGFSPYFILEISLIRLEMAKIPILSSQYLVFAKGKGSAPSSRFAIPLSHLWKQSLAK